MTLKTLLLSSKAYQKHDGYSCLDFDIVIEITNKV